MADEPRPARRRGSPPGCGGGRDLISALPDDLLLVILARLDYHRDAVRTSLLSRRWRRLSNSLNRMRINLRRTEIYNLASALRHLGVLLPVFRALLAAQHRAFEGLRVLDISVPARDRMDGEDVEEALLAASELSPVEFRFTLPCFLDVSSDHVGLPRFHRATSIELHARYLCFGRMPKDFPVVERLSLTGCCIDLTTLVSLCPRLRVLRTNSLDLNNIVINSESLQELHTQNEHEDYCIHVINIVAPALKRLMLSVITNITYLPVSISAPMLNKISWKCKYNMWTIGIGKLWRLRRLNLETQEEQRALTIKGEAKCLSMCLSLHISACNTLCAEPAGHTFAAEIAKLQAGDFSTLELYLKLGKPAHVWTSVVQNILGIDRIRTTTRRLKLVLQRSEVDGACAANCPCDEPKDWSCQIISLTNLEEVEIEDCEGQDYEFDFLKLVSRCAPKLKRTTTVRRNDMSDQFQLMLQALQKPR